MKKYRYSLFYVVTLLVFSVLVWWIVHLGRGFRDETGHAGSHSGEPSTSFLDLIAANAHYPLAVLLTQVLVILFAARLLGRLFRKLGQPSVIGEIAAGIVLGPSVLGHFWPEGMTALFPAASIPNLQVLSQLGLILFMFVVGMELDLGILKKKAREGILISHASIVIPFSLGMILAYFLYPDFGLPGVGFLSFALFMGISMSVTAFPVLARILQERRIQHTKAGQLAIMCAASDDVTAWSILAVVISIVRATSIVSALITIGMTVVYVVLMIKVARPLLEKMVARDMPGLVSRSMVTVCFMTLVVSAFLAEVIGIHALFGAFLTGAIMPAGNNFRKVFSDKVEDLALVLLLPLFFVFTGLRTDIGLIYGAQMWMITGLITLVAVAGKFGGSALSARFVGENMRESLIIGALMNTRGLMELVVLNIGYDLGVFSPRIFTMLVIMALLTTMMTGPLLNLIDRILNKNEPEQV